MLINISVDEESKSEGVVVEQMRVDTRKEAKLFHMLSNTLYSNKPAAIIRELCSNAYDSHIMAGRPDEFIEITRPSYENPELVIRDKGVGLTAQEAKDTILCYLGSSKDHSDEFIGGWGIGSKSPFSYAKNYTVICVKNGRRVEFLCWKDDHGLPQSAIVNEGDSDEPPGVEVRVPIDAGDIFSFSHELDEYLAWTNYNVRVHSVDGVQVRRATELRADTGAFSIEMRQGIGGIRLVYGGFSYDVKGCIDPRESIYTGFQQILAKKSQEYSLLIIADTPGSLTFNMNREEIEQTETSKNFIRNALTKIIEGVKKQTSYFDEFSAKFYKHGESEEDDVLLVDVAERINDVLKNDDPFEEIIAKNFDVFGKTYSYPWKGVVYRFPNRSHTAIREARHQFLIKDVASQLSVLFSRNLRPNRFNINESLEKVKNKNNPIFITANSEDEAREKISSMEDFKGFDISGIDFVEIENPVVKRESNGQIQRCKMPPRPYCTSKKKYFSWKPETFYVCVKSDPSVIESSDEFKEIKNKFSKIHSAPQFRRYVLFVPTHAFTTKHGDCENVMGLEEFKKYVNDSFDKLASEYLWPSNPFWHNKFDELLNAVTKLRYKNIPDHIAGQMEELRYEARVWRERAEHFSSCMNRYIQRSECKYFEKHMNLLQTAISRGFEAERVFRYLHYPAIERAYKSLKKLPKNSEEYKSLKSDFEFLSKTFKLDKFLNGD